MIRPGLTGIAQISASRDIPFRGKFKYDIWYVRNRNFRLDIKIIMMSFFVTFTGKWETRKDKFKNISKHLGVNVDKEISRIT